mmetsp:Transcript_2690/g.4397  ORF Transcript_2690/g.4397 Transcript_2690/m.4397 type:complete len:286 (+) Transcript_2690:53-910(+)
MPSIHIIIIIINTLILEIGIPSEIRIAFIFEVLLFVLEVVKVGQVFLRLDLILDGRLHVLLLQRAPIKLLEPVVAADQFRTALNHTESFGGLWFQELGDEILSRRRQIPRKLELALNDLAIRHHRLVVEEGRKRGQHLIDEDAERPPIHSLAVALSGHNLRRQVIGRSAQRKRLIRHYLGKAKVGHLEIAGIGQHQVLWLQISVNDVSVVHIIERFHYARTVKLGRRLIERAHFTQDGEELAAQTHLQQEIHAILVLVGSAQVHQKRTVQHLHHLLLVENMRLLS